MSVPVRRAFVATPQGTVHFRQAGSSGPALVLFHESPLSSVIFERVLPLLGERLQVFALDTPGYGLSEAPPAPPEIRDYAARLLAAVDALGIRQFVAGGAHTGASLAVELAAAVPDRVTHVILSGLPLLTPEERAKYLSNWSPDLALDAGGDHLRWAWQRYQRIWGADSPPELLNLAVIQLVGNYGTYNWAYNAAFRHDPEPPLRRMACPILLLNSAGDLLNYTDERVMALKPGTAFVPVAGLRGQLPWRDPERYTSEVFTFLGV